MSAPTEAFGVTVKADFRDFERALLRARNETDSKLTSMERRFDKSNSNVRRQTSGLAAAARGSLGELTAAVSNAGAGIPGIGAGMSRLGVVGIAAAAGVGALALSLKGVADAAKFAADLTDAADRIGVGVEALQELRYAADETGVDLAKLDQGLEALNGTLGAFKTNIGAGKIKPIFAALGITQADLADVHNATDLLPLLADRLGQVGDRAEQVQLARKLGIEALLPLLRQGSDNIARMAGEGRDLGLVMSQDVVQGLDATDRALERNKQQIDANVRSMYAGLAPFFVWATNQLARLGRGIGDIFNGIKAVEQRNDRVLSQRSTWLQGQVTAGRGRGLIGGGLLANREAELARVNAEIGRRARDRIAAGNTPAPDAADRTREGGYELDLQSTGSRGGGGGGGGGADRSRDVLREAREALQRQRRFEDALQNVQESVLRATEEQAFTTRERRDAALAALARDEAARRIDLDRQETDGEITAVERRQLAEADAALGVVKRDTINRRAEADITEARLESERRLADFRAEAVQIQAAGATTEVERQRVAKELLRLAQIERRLALERIAADPKASLEERGAAQTMLGALPGREEAERGVLGQQSRPAQQAGGIAQGILDQDNLGADTAAMYAEINRLRQTDVLNEQQAAQARAQINAQYWDQRLSGEQSMLGELASMANSSNSTLARIGKAAAIAQATIDGILAVQKALASAPPPMNYVMAAATGIAAAANVAQIAGMADGGPVRGPGGPRADKIPVMLSNGEFVVNAGATKSHRALLEAINSGGGLKGYAMGGMAVSTSEAGPVALYLEGPCRL